MTAKPQSDRFILTLSCRDRIGIVNAVASTLADNGCNIADSAQFGDPKTKHFFMRVCFEAPHGRLDDAKRMLTPVFARFEMTAEVHLEAKKTRAVLLVSKFGHCLNDLLYRKSIGALPIEIPCVVSNHRDFEKLVQSHGIDFHYLPINPETKLAQEDRLDAVVRAAKADLIVLARYMQILSTSFSDAYAKRIINIHHSFLPSFKGAKPYHQAHARGVKLIGATAHYVTQDLDEGPIIEQDVVRVDHAMSPDDLVAMGRDVESQVLARAVSWHAQHRVLLNGDRTVVFR